MEVGEEADTETVLLRKWLDTYHIGVSEVVLGERAGEGRHSWLEVSSLRSGKMISWLQYHCSIKTTQNNYQKATRSPWFYPLPPITLL